MQRALLNDLQEWLVAKDRLPLIIRGARQVGKTWLVRHLAQANNKQLIELNFEKEPKFKSLFDSNDPQKIVMKIETALEITIVPDQCLLFLDEIQAVPELIAKLRWFAEDMPALPVISAGSLLEFVLEKHQFSMPVGRVSYLHLEPLSFEEFLLANQKQKIHEFINTYEWSDSIPEIIHQQLHDLFKEYVIVGGLPAAVSHWSENRSLGKVSQIHSNLLTTYRDDFAKYSGKLAVDKLDDVLLAVPKMLGKKFVYSRIDNDIKTASAKIALQLLNKARLCHKVHACYANGLPLAAELNEKFFKVIFLDVGLVGAMLGLTFNQMDSVKDLTLVNQGGISEQVVGQLLRTIIPAYVEPKLYYWLREEKNAAAEVDYIMQHGSEIVPIEVKSGSSGSLKSLHLLMALRKLNKAVRINSDFPSKMSVNTKTQMGDTVEYQLLSVPFYLIGQIHRLLCLSVSH